jgi:hypothetical protein
MRELTSTPAEMIVGMTLTKLKQGPGADRFYIHRREWIAGPIELRTNPSVAHHCTPA